MDARPYHECRRDLSPDGKQLIYFAMDGRWESEIKGVCSTILLGYAHLVPADPAGLLFECGLNFYQGNPKRCTRDGIQRSFRTAQVNRAVDMCQALARWQRRRGR